MNELLLRRRALMMAQKKSRLPSAYQEVEHLESTGTQYIDTGVLATDIGVVEMEQQFTSIQKRQEHGCTRFGYPGTRNQIYVIRILDQFMIQFGTGGDDIFFNFYNTAKHKWKADLLADTCQIDAVVRENCNFVKWEGEPVYTFHLFARKANINGALNIQDYCYCKIFSCQFHNRNNQLVRDFIPCYRKSDHKPGMYDLCGSICPLTNSPFYINSGNGEFTVGPDVN